MAFAIAIFILAVAVVAAVFLASGKSRKMKFIVWGLTTMIVIAPIFSWLVSISFAIIVEDGFAGIGLMVLMFPVIFLIGIILLLVGIFTKTKQGEISDF